MMKIILLMLVLATLGACEITSKVETSQGTDEIAYRWDEAHDLCFAMMASKTYYGYNVVSLTYVPLSRERCSEIGR